ncbi:alcohol dehydrogenase catalytic domain-containing protein [Planomonospora algeriensis]
MKALCWQGVDELSVEQVPDPQILNAQDMIVKVRLTTTCGSDLHLLGGYIPAMRAGDVIGHEFIGEAVAVGSEVRRHKMGDRVVVCSFISCGPVLRPASAGPVRPPGRTGGDVLRAVTQTFTRGR